MSIRVSLTPEGDVLAELDLERRVIIDRRTGNLISTTVGTRTDAFRWMVKEARKEVRP